MAKNIKGDSAISTLQNLCQLAEKLRSDTGCPWDREQTMDSMLKCAREEFQEFCEAMEKKDYENIQEEIGDTLFQLVMITQIAKENGHFTMEDVLRGIDYKIRSRHTWVFGKDKVSTPEEAVAMWKKNKEKEKAEKAAKAASAKK